MKILSWLAMMGLATAAAASSLVPVSFQFPALPAAVTGDGGSGGGEWVGEATDLGGRYVLFLGTSDNLIPSDGNGGVLDLFRRDRKEGRTELVSVTSTGGSGKRPVLGYSPSRSGERIAFSWGSDDPGVGDTNGLEDVYLRDLAAGKTLLVSVRADGAGPGNGASSMPVLAGGGRYVAFESEATDLTAIEDLNRSEDVFLRDLETGTTELISAGVSGQPGDRSSRQPLVNEDGSVVVFRSEATTLAPLEGFATDLLVWVRASRSVTRVTLPGRASPPLSRPLFAEQPVLSGDGRYLAFFVGAPSVLPNDYSGVWWFDLSTGERHRASGSANVSAFPFVGEPSMADDGRTLAFTVVVGSAADSPLRVRVWTPEGGMKSLDELRLTVPPTAGEPSASFQAFIAPRADSLLFVSSEPVPEAGVTEGDQARLYHRVLATGATRLISDADVFFPGSINADSTWVLSETQEPVVDPGDDNGALDVMLTRLSDGHREAVSLARPHEGLRTASGASLGGRGFSDDGRYLAFTSTAHDVVPGDTNRLQDVFVFDREGPTNQWVEVPPPDGDATGRIQSVILARGGRHAAFVSTLAGLAAGDTNQVADVFVRDLQSGTTDLVSAVDGTDQSLNLVVSDPQVSADGRWVAFLALPSNPGLGRVLLYLRDRAERRTYWINPRSRTGRGSSDASNVQMSADGLTVSFTEGSRTCFVHRQDGNPNAPLISVNGSYGWLSADGRALVALTPTFDPAPGLFYQRVGTDTTRRLLEGPASGIRDPKMSADGMVVTHARRSDPTGPLAGNPYQVWAISVASGAEELISATRTGQAGQGDSRDPQISADGRFIVFRSAAEDLVAGDNNGLADIFVRDRYTGVTSLLSRTEEGVYGNSLSTRPQISGDGDYAAFTTFADNLLPGDMNGLEDVVLAVIPREAAPDTDRDDLPDGWERDQFGSLEKNGADDVDKDGQDNAAEYAARTVPTDAGSMWWVRWAADGPGPAITWTGHAGLNYRVEHRATIGPEGNWMTVWESLSGHEGTMTAPLGSPNPTGYYRVTATAP